MRVWNKFKDHAVAPETEILILGTFSPDTPGAPDFFFGRSRNYLWHMLPKCFGLPPLKDADLKKKLDFMAAHKLDFADLIDSIEVPEGEEHLDEDLLDAHIDEWKDIISLIDHTPGLKAIYYTRKTFNGMPNVRSRMNDIARYCQAKGIRVCKLDTPARHFSDQKQQQWIDTIILQKTCLRIS